MKRIELIILGLLWLCAIATYPIALVKNYNLFTSDYVGLIGLLIVTTIAFFRPDKLLVSLLALLFVGTLNLASFIYFINLTMAFGFGSPITPGIQFLSLVLFAVLFFKRKKEIRKLYKGTPEDIIRDQELAKLAVKNQYKKRFERLTDKEIESKLQLDLVPEAKQALKEIAEERKNEAQ